MIALSGGMIVRVERQCNVWLCMSASIKVCTFFRALKESKSNIFPGLSVKFVTLRILWHVNSEKGVIWEGLGGCLVVVDVHDCLGFGEGV